MKSRLTVATLLVCHLVVTAFAGADAKPAVRAEPLHIKVLNDYPHDPTAFTQGLLWHEGSLYESTGHYGASSLRRVEPTTGTVLEQYNLDDQLFAEGLVLVDGRLVQLTWESGLALVYTLEGFAQVDQFVYPGEGWGLAWDGRQFIMSDGSARLAFRHPTTFEELSSVEVKLGGQPLKSLNELEYVDGELFANVWKDDRIFRIDPATGTVTAVIDASAIARAVRRTSDDVLNGIAYDPESATFWITGKNWTRMYQVVFVSAPPS